MRSEAETRGGAADPDADPHAGSDAGSYTPGPDAPRLAAAPTLGGAGEIGVEVSADPGRWTGDVPPRLAFQWRLDGVPIPGAVAGVYVPVPADDGGALDCAITARAPAGATAGAAVAIAGPLRVRHAPPVVVDALPEEVFDQGAGPQRVETACAFSGAELRFTATGVPGVAIDARCGALSVPTDRPVSGAEVTVTAANSGGAAAARLVYTVEAEALETPDPAPPPLGAGCVEILGSVAISGGPAGAFSPRLRFPGLAGETVDAIEWTLAPDPAAEAGWGPVRPAPDAPGLHAIFAPGSSQPAGPAPVDPEAAGDAQLRFRWRALAEGDWSAPGAAWPIPLPAADALPPPSRKMVRAAMTNGGKLRRFNDYDFVGYSQKDAGPFRSTAVRSKKQAHLSSIVALAAWAGDARRYAGRTPAARAAETLTFWANDQVPAARGGVGMQADLMFANCAALGRATPAVWEAVEPADRARIDRAMEGLLVSAAWQNSDANPWVLAGKLRAERTLTGGDYSRNRVPNFTSSSALMPYVVTAYMGTAQADAFLAGFEREAFAAAIRAANGAGALDDLEATFARDWTGGPKGPGPTAGELAAALRGPGGYRQFGLGLHETTAAVAREIGRMWSRTIRAGLDPAEVGRVPPGVEKRPGEIGVFEHARFEGAPNRARGRDAQVARLTDMAAWPSHAYAGMDGMATELDTTDGGAAGSGGGPRSSMSYAAEGCSILLTACATLAALGRLDRADPALAAALARQGRGVYDMRFRSTHGHRSFAKGGRNLGGDERQQRLGRRRGRGLPDGRALRRLGRAARALGRRLKSGINHGVALGARGGRNCATVMAEEPGSRAGRAIGGGPVRPVALVRDARQRRMENQVWKLEWWTRLCQTCVCMSASSERTAVFARLQVPQTGCEGPKGPCENEYGGAAASG